MRRESMFYYDATAGRRTIERLVAWDASPTMPARLRPWSRMLFERSIDEYEYPENDGKCRRADGCGGVNVDLCAARRPVPRRDQSGWIVASQRAAHPPVP